MKHLHNLLPAYSNRENGTLAFDIRELKDLRETGVFQRNDHFLIVWVAKGQGTYCIAQQKGLIANNHLLFIKPGQLDALRLTDDAEGHVISFNRSFLDGANCDAIATCGNFYRVFARYQTIAEGPELDDMQVVLGIMIKEINRNNLCRCELLKRYLEIFLVYLSGQLENPQLPRQTRNEKILDNFLALLEKKFRTQKMVADYAEAMSVTPNYLNEVIKKTTGYSAGHHIRQRVALEAKKQALSSNTCMKNVAYDLGFCDMAHFSKYFKNVTGVNFSDFKNRDSALQPIN